MVGGARSAVPAVPRCVLVIELKHAVLVEEEAVW